MSLDAVLYTRPGEAAELQAALAGVPGVAWRGVSSLEAFERALATAEAAILPMYLYDGAAAQALRDAPRLRWIQSMSVGLDRLLADPPSAHVAVTTAGDGMASAIADHAMGLLLALARRIPGFVDSQAAGHWNAAARANMRGLQGLTLAIVGYGAIGRELGRRARAFGMKVVGLRRQPAADPHADEVLARADAVAITAPLSTATRGLFDAARLARMRRGAWLVNVSRGAIVDTPALVEALVAGHLGGAGLDVVDPEPPGSGHPVWTAPHLLLTPHVAAAGSGAAVAAFIAANVQRFVAGLPLLALHPSARI